MPISRKCIPFTPFEGELSRSTIAIVTAGGVHLNDQEPFNIADELGDLTYRIIPEDVDSSQLKVTHHHYDHSDADRDINVVFPIDVLRDLQAERFIKGIAKKHVGYMGYTMQLKAMYEGTAREIANEIDKGSRADAVVLTGGWPNVCHRTVVAVQREIEMRGIPTVLITISPEVSAQMRPPRALYPKGFKIGNSLGGPGMRELQAQVLRDALTLLSEDTRPGRFITREYPAYGEYHEPPRVRKWFKSQQLEDLTRKETRCVVLGHLQRGGRPNAFDRMLATTYGAHSVRALAEGKHGTMVALQAGDVITVPICEAVANVKTVPPGGQMIRTARDTGISFGAVDESKYHVCI